MFKKTMLEIIILILLVVIIGVTGQLFLKIGLREIGQIRLTNLRSVAQNIIQLFTSQLIIVGLIFCAISAFFWLVVLSRADLNFLYPLAGGLFYIVLFLASWFFLKESVSFTHLFGVIIILAGIIILTKA